MYAPKQFALGVVILLLAAFFARNHYRRWRDRFGDAVEDYFEAFSRGYVLPVVIIAFLFLFGGATVYASCIPDGVVLLTSSVPFVHVTTKGALHPPRDE